MIHHLSLPAQNPLHVARVFVELLGGTLTAFAPHPNSYIAWAGDAAGTAIEVYPVGTELFPNPGGGQAQFRNAPGATGFSATHAAVSVPGSEGEVLAIAQREGWRALRLSRGSNDVIEFWVENRVLLEILTPDMARNYALAAQKLRRSPLSRETGRASFSAKEHGVPENFMAGPSVSCGHKESSASFGGDVFVSSQSVASEGG
jgi:hypothetical protein